MIYCPLKINFEIWNPFYFNWWVKSKCNSAPK